MKSKSLISILGLVVAGIFAFHRFAPLATSPTPKLYQTQQIQQTTQTQQSSQSTQSSSVLGTRTKTAGCLVQGPLPDKDCTPGAVNPSLTKETICNSSFTTKTVRNVPSIEKRQVYSEYGITSHQPGQYEVDHLISLELGGSNDIANLWPEAAEPRPGFHEKDTLENNLHAQVCSGAISLQDAQQQIASNWLALYQKNPH